MRSRAINRYQLTETCETVYANWGADGITMRSKIPHVWNKTFIIVSGSSPPASSHWVYSQKRDVPTAAILMNRENTVKEEVRQRPSHEPIEIGADQPIV